MKDITIIDYVDSFGPIGKELYAAKRLKDRKQDPNEFEKYLSKIGIALNKLAKRNMRVLLRKQKVKRVCLKDQN